MAESITLQTSDNNVQQSGVLGRVSFAASNESNSADARLIAASVHAEAEGDFTEISNPTSIVFSTANSESATSKLKINSSGHFIPLNNKTYDIGSSSLQFRNLFSESTYTDKVILTSGSGPLPTTNTLYNLSGVLHYDTKAIALLPSGGLQNQILQKVSNASYDLQWADMSSSSFATEVDVYVKNTTGSGLLKGQAVYINGAQGDHPTITLSQANAESTSSKTIGLLKQDLADNAFGYVISEGLLTDVDTNNAGSAGDPIWLSPSTPGGLIYGLANKPSAPDHLVFIGYVLRKQQNQGIIYIRPQNGFELQELHNVRINGVSNSDILTYNSSSGVWANTTNPSGSLNNSINTVSGMFVSGSGALNNRISTHTHTSSQITDFNSSVSGLLPVKNILAGANITVSSLNGDYTINSTGGSGGSTGILEYATTSLFPASGTSQTLYLATDSSRIYRWIGSEYIEAGPIGSPLLWANVPTSPSSSGIAGDLAYDDNFFYICTSSNIWKRAFISNSVILEYVVVGGGGGGAAWRGPGGGAGGYLYGFGSATPGTAISVTVGAGGAGGTTGGSLQNARGTSGGNSVLALPAGNITAFGGGYGAAGLASLLFGAAADDGGSGGSGGGGSGYSPAGTGGSGTSGQGTAGGNGFAASEPYNGGGGGGATAAGGSAVSPANGGDGSSAQSAILSAVSAGELVSGARWLAGGGGAGSYNSTPGTGGKGGGGAGGNSGANGSNGIANTGGGGGGGGNSANGGSGGSGVVIIRYQDIIAAATTTGSPIVINTGGYRYYMFTNNGSFTIPW